MEISLLLSMSGFALAMSISPGPVNLVALGTGARYGFPASLRHVVGATLGFILLLLLMGLGLGGALSRWPVAAGAAWSAQYRGTEQVAVCFFGDGTTNIGAFHESLNLALCDLGLIAPYGTPGLATTGVA